MKVNKQVAKHAWKETWKDFKMLVAVSAFIAVSVVVVVVLYSISFWLLFAFAIAGFLWMRYDGHKQGDK